MLELMTRHPEAVGETYGEHLGAAWSIAGTLMVAGFACLIHGLLPFAFETTASRSIRRLHSHITQRTAPNPRPIQVDAPA
jgi:hypothetical protein